MEEKPRTAADACNDEWFRLFGLSLSGSLRQDNVCGRGAAALLVGARGLEEPAGMMALRAV